MPGGPDAPLPTAREIFEVAALRGWLSSPRVFSAAVPAHPPAWPELPGGISAADIIVLEEEDPCWE